jgi:hypothetical protein
LNGARNIQEGKGLRTIIDLKQLPKATTLIIQNYDEQNIS